MEAQSKMTYSADIVFCIDTCKGMAPLIERLPELIPEYCSNLARYMNVHGRPLSGLRARIIAYRDYLSDGERAMQVTRFFDLPQEAEHLRAALGTLEASGGVRPNDGLEALAYAIRSDWNRDPRYCYQIIMVLTDAPTHPLGFGKASPFYPKGMAKNFEELSAWWGSQQTPGYLDEYGKRLIIFAPYSSGWKSIVNGWNKVMLDTSVRWSELENFWNFNIFAPDL